MRKVKICKSSRNSQDAPMHSHNYRDSFADRIQIATTEEWNCRSGRRCRNNCRNCSAGGNSRLHLRRVGIYCALYGVMLISTCLRLLFGFPSFLFNRIDRQASIVNLQKETRKSFFQRSMHNEEHSGCNQKVSLNFSIKI